MDLFWGLFNLLQKAFLLLWSAIWIPVALFVRVATGSVRLPLAMARRIWAPPLIWLSRSPLEVRGADRVDFARPHLFAANHQSILDIPILFVALPVGLRFVARRSLRTVPLLGWYMRAMGMVFVERARGVRRGRGGSAAKAVLRRGECLLTFPEGTRTHDGSLGAFQGASLVPAIEVGCPVVPIAIDGAFATLPRGGFRIRPAKIRVTICEPIATSRLSVADRRSLAQRVRQAVEEASLDRAEGGGALS